MIRLSDKSAAETEEMKLLWKECFGDSDSFIDFYFSKGCANNKIVIMREDNILTGMLHLNPYVFTGVNHEQIRTYYVVGVAVREGYRNQGRMKRLFDYAGSVLNSERIKFVYLWPANPDIYSTMGFQTVSQMVDIRINRSDFELLRDEMVTAKCDMEFGKLIRQLIMPHYSSENISTMVSELSSEGGDFFCLEKKGIAQGFYSVLRCGDTLEVDHIVPYFGLREYTSKLFDSIGEVLDRIDEEEREKALNDESESEEEASVEWEPGVKYIKITMDLRLLNCYRHTLDMNQVSLSRQYMSVNIADSDIDTERFLFSEIV